MPWSPGRTLDEIEKLRANPNYLPTPINGKTWIAERDSIYPFKSTKEYHAENLRELRRLSAESGMPLMIERENAEARARQRPINDALPDPVMPDAPADTPDEPRSVATRVKPDPVPKSKKLFVPDGYITISTLAETWKREPFACRAALRNSDMIKPPYGWAFAPNEIDKIAKICGVS